MVIGDSNEAAFGRNVLEVFGRNNIFDTYLFQYLFRELGTFQVRVTGLKFVYLVNIQQFHHPAGCPLAEFSFEAQGLLHLGNRQHLYFFFFHMICIIVQI